MDLSSLKPTERQVEILHPGTDEELGIRITLVSINDERLKKAKRRIQDEKLRLEVRGKNFKSEDIEENAIELDFAAMTGWEWYGKDVNFNGSKPEFNRANVKAVFESLPWFQRQVEEAISDEKAFFTK